MDGWMDGVMSKVAARLVVPSRWELAAEAIAVKIRWFGVLLGYVVVNIATHPPERLVILNGLLTLGTLYTTLDTWFSLRGRVFLGRSPLVISFMEGLFIALLCFHDSGLDSPFRYYYFLSLICCAVRHPSHITYSTCAIHSISYGLLYLALPPAQQRVFPLVLTLVMLGWVTWASDALAMLLKRVGDHLGDLNAALQGQQAELENRIAERTAQLQESQAHVLHQEKMAAFGLLAAGIAHEVGNPLTSISSLVQMLQRHESDPYTLNKLSLVSGQCARIQTTLRELLEFSRPASTERSRVALADILDEALNIAKYYKRTRGRIATPPIPPDLPPIFCVKDQLVQVFLNLVLNAIDAITPQAADGREGKVELSVNLIPAEAAAGGGGEIEVTVADTGCGIDPGNASRLFQPYFTTKKHGTGLGLFVSQQLVTDHGGSVSFESEPGRGTKFRVRLPLAVPHSASSSVEAKAVSASSQEEVVAW
jgi:signal transduction histidine kinase